MEKYEPAKNGCSDRIASIPGMDVVYVRFEK